MQEQELAQEAWHRRRGTEALQEQRQEETREERREVGRGGTKEEGQETRGKASEKGEATKGERWRNRMECRRVLPHCCLSSYFLQHVGRHESLLLCVPRPPPPLPSPLLLHHPSCSRSLPCTPTSYPGS